MGGRKEVSSRGLEWESVDSKAADGRRRKGTKDDEEEGGRMRE